MPTQLETLGLKAMPNHVPLLIEGTTAQPILPTGTNTQPRSAGRSATKLATLPPSALEIIHDPEHHMPTDRYMARLAGRGIGRHWIWIRWSPSPPASRFGRSWQCDRDTSPGRDRYSKADSGSISATQSPILV